MVTEGFVVTGGPLPPATETPTASVPPPVVDPYAPIVALVAPIAQQAAKDASAGLHQLTVGLVAGVQTQVDSLAADVADNRAAIEDAMAKAGGAVLTAVSEDVWLQRAVVLSVVGAVLVGALGVIAFAMLGNATANHWVGAAPASIIALVLWLSKAGAVNLPTNKPTTLGGPR